MIRQYHPDLNHGFTLTQIPPAAEVLLLWECDAGHRFAATPGEQRDRPGRERRRSSWCPECRELALKRPVARPRLPSEVDAAVAGTASGLVIRGAAGPVRPAVGAAAARPRKPARPARPLCAKTPDLPVGEAFVSVCAPKPASVIEGELRQHLAELLDLDQSANAIRLGRAFFDHVEAWPDVLLPELRIAIEYDSTGRHGLEHVGRREAVDRRKDRAVRAAGWEVVRIRTGKLPALGPHDLLVSGLTKAFWPRLLDELRAIRGELFVDAYLR
nr:zinc-ribbon domain-containing protein [Schumannella luteola]